MSEQKLTGYPSIDKPWLRFYESQVQAPAFPQCTMYEYVLKESRQHQNAIAMEYYGTKISFGQFFERVDQCAAAFSREGVRCGEM